MSGDFIQLGYVTNDIDRAVEEFKSMHAVGSFKVMRDLHLPTAADREAVAHYALAFKNGMQFEIIAPVGGDVDLYTQALVGEGFAIRFHHVGRFLSSLQEYRRVLADARDRWPMPIDHGAFGGYFAYADARADVGHYLEFFSFPDEQFFADVPRY